MILVVVHDLYYMIRDSVPLDTIDTVNLWFIANSALLYVKHYHTTCIYTLKLREIYSS